MVFLSVLGPVVQTKSTHIGKSIGFLEKSTIVRSKDKLFIRHVIREDITKIISSVIIIISPCPPSYWRTVIAVGFLFCAVFFYHLGSQVHHLTNVSNFV